jgi:hypothetical protein
MSMAKILENVVHNELVFRGYKVYTGWNVVREDEGAIGCY